MACCTVLERRIILAVDATLIPAGANADAEASERKKTAMILNIVTEGNQDLDRCRTAESDCMNTSCRNKINDRWAGCREALFFEDIIAQKIYRTYVRETKERQAPKKDHFYDRRY